MATLSPNPNFGFTNVGFVDRGNEAFSDAATAAHGLQLGAIENVNPMGDPTGIPNISHDAYVESLLATVPGLDPQKAFPTIIPQPMIEDRTDPAIDPQFAMPPAPERDTSVFDRTVVPPPSVEKQLQQQFDRTQPQPIDYQVPSYFDQAIPDLSYTSPMFNNPIAPTPAVPIAPPNQTGIPQGWTQSPIGKNPYGLPEDTPMFSPPPVSMPDMGPPTNVQPQPDKTTPLGPPMSQLTTPQTLTAFPQQSLPQPPIQFQPPLSFPQKDQDPYQIDQMDLVPAPFPDFNIVNPMFESLAPHATPEFQDISVPNFSAPQTMEQAMGQPDQGDPGTTGFGPDGSTASGNVGGMATGGGAASTGEEGGGGGAAASSSTGNPGGMATGGGATSDGGEGGGAAASSSTGNPGGMATGGGATSDGGEGGATGSGPGPGDAGNDGGGTGV